MNEDGRSMVNIGLQTNCKRILKQSTLTSFTICPDCGLIITNGDHKYLEHPMAQGIIAHLDSIKQEINARYSN